MFTFCDNCARELSETGTNPFENNQRSLKTEKKTLKLTKLNEISHYCSRSETRRKQKIVLSCAYLR